jgi:hypothetical protein
MLPGLDGISILNSEKIKQQDQRLNSNRKGFNK